MIHISTLSELAPYSGQSLVEKLSLNFGRSQLEQFLAFSGDSNPIHIVGGSLKPVIPANLLISIIPSILQSHIEFAGDIKCFTVGYRDVRFKKQIRLEDEILLSIKFKTIKLHSDAAYIDYQFRFDGREYGSASAQGIMSDFCIPVPPSLS